MAERADIATAIHIGKNVERLTLGENLFHGPIFEGTGISVFCIVTGGYFPTAILGNSGGVYKSSVDIRIRGDRNKYDEGLTLAKEIQEAVEFSSLGTDYIMARVENSMPSYIGQNNNGDPEWVIFLVCTYKE